MNLRIDRLVHRLIAGLLLLTVLSALMLISDVVLADIPEEDAVRLSASYRTDALMQANYSAIVPPNTQPGLLGQYYDYEWGPYSPPPDPFGDGTLEFEQIDPRVHFHWGGGSPAFDLLGNDKFAIRWTGWVRSPVTGLVSFRVHSDDGSRLQVGNQSHEQWVICGDCNNYLTLDMVADEWLPINLEFFEYGGVAQIQLMWKLPSESQYSAVPQEHLLAPLPPVADFMATPISGTAPLTVVFTNTSTSDVTDWQWDFGDGTNSTAQHPTHIYNETGIYTVTLAVTGPGGSDTLTRTSYITATQPAPVADFIVTPLSGTSPLSVTFTDYSTGTITSWLWDFGDGITSTSQNPTHTYSEVGTYSVTLTVDGLGGSDTLARPDYITVTPATSSPGDCNSDSNVDAGDLSALVLEIFGGGSGNQSCDSNEDTEINAADISCTVLLIFNGPGACAAPPTP